MRKLIIDTDTGSDDAVALLMALRSPEVEVLGITTVSGNVPLEQATQNALMTVEVCGSRVPVYKGAAKPLFRELVTAVNVHGRDGMGDLDLIHPQSAAQATHAVDYLIETVRANPGEVEIVTIGPATNLALAMLKEPQVMRRTKHIWSMGTAGFGPGNTTPVAEFNVYVDAESYAVLLNGGAPLTIVGIDQCKGNAVWTAQDMEEIRAGSRVGCFAVDCNSVLRAFQKRRCGQDIVDLPDPVTMAVALWDDVALDKARCHCYCCTREEEAYGQVILHEEGRVYAIDRPERPVNAEVVRRIDVPLYKARLKELLIGAEA